MRAVTPLLRCRPRVLLLIVTAAALTACGSGSEGATNILGYPNGAGPESPELTTFETLAMYIIVPGAIFGGVALLVWLPGLIRGSYRPGRGWSAPPLWFAGPDNPTKAVESADPKGMPRGGASGSW